jgi:3-hydroxyacyl-CoA dehydrogenase
MLFAAEGHQVRLYDTIPEVSSAAPGIIYEKIKDLESKGQLKNHKVKGDEQCKLIKGREYENIRYVVAISMIF